MQNYVEFKDTNAEFKMIFVESGVFDMGGESFLDNAKPIHKVSISDYWIGEFLVTQSLWKMVMSNSNIATPSNFKGINRPVENVSWSHIVEDFLRLLNGLTKENRPLGTIYRLPTESEWEYAARGGKYWQYYPFEYAGSDKIDEAGWYRENSYRETQTVGLKIPNLLGLYDMSGNLFEWCGDSCNNYKDSIIGTLSNSMPSTTSSDRIFRGGSWMINALFCNSTYRFNTDFTDRNNNLGFRLVLSYSSV
jgi:formylglycine-generating enzyme required for sulfatase activity